MVFSYFRELQLSNKMVIYVGLPIKNDKDLTAAYKAY